MLPFPTSPLNRRCFLGRLTTATGLLAAPKLFAAEVSASDRDKIEAAIPPEAFAKSRRPRTLLIFDHNVNYGGHKSIPTANLAFTRMGRKTGAFETVVRRDPAVFARENLREFDAVFLNNPDREVLRPIRYQRRAAQSRPESIAGLLAPRQHRQGLPRPQPSARRVRRCGLLDPRRD